MRLRTPLVITAVAAAMIGGASLPAMAVTSDPVTTTTTFALTGGDLTLTAATGATLTNAASGTTAITGNLGAVSVTDARGGTVAWNVSALSSTFTGVLGSVSDTVSYTGGAVVETGTITVADGAATVIDAELPVVSPASLSGNNTASWDPTLDVTMPAGALADDYTGTVTTSIL